MGLADWHTLRKGLRYWDKTPSGLNGAVTLSNPRFAEPDLGPAGFASPKVPIVLLPEELHRRGWTPSLPRQQLSPQTTALPGAFSRAQMHKQCKPYFACLVFLQQLLDKGLGQLIHNGTSAYYALILRSPQPGTVDAGAKADIQ